MQIHLFRFHRFPARLLLAIGLPLASLQADFARDVTREFQLKQGQRFEITTQSADVKVDPAAPGQPVRITVSVKVSSNDLELAESIFESIEMAFSEDPNGARASIDNGRPGLRWFGLIRVFPEIHVHVAAPANLDLQVSTRAGNISLHDLTCSVSIATGSGNINASRINGNFSAKTGSGNLALDDFNGPLTFESGSGNLNASGAVHFFDIGTASGNVSLQSNRALLAESSAKTASGNIRIQLPPSAAFKVSANSASGKIRSQFPTTRATQSQPNALSADINHGTIQLTLQSASGNIRLDQAQ